MDLLQGNQTIHEDDPIVEPSEAPQMGTLKMARLSRLTKYKEIKNRRQRVLQIIIDHGPICTCFVAAYAGLSEGETQEIIEELRGKEIDAIEIYSEDEDAKKGKVSLYRFRHR